MKVIHINSYYAPNFHGGADRSVQPLAEGLQDAGHDVVVVCLAKDSESYTRNMEGVKVIYLAVNNSLSHIRARGNSAVKKACWQLWTAVNPFVSQAIRKIFREEQPDLLHTHILAGFSLKPWSIAAELGIPIVHTLHDYFHICPRGTMYRGNSYCQHQCADCRFVVSRRYKHSHCINAVIGVSNHILDKHLDLGYFKDVPIRTRIFNSSPIKQASLAPQTNDSGRLRLGFLGRLEPFKGLDYLLSSISQLPPERLTLNIAGIGSDHFVNSLQEKWPLANIKYLGLVHPGSFFPQIDVLIVPSKYHDPAPRVLMEAYGYGVPVMGSNFGGIPELIDEGQTGWIFDSRDPESMARKLQKLIEQPGLWQGLNKYCIDKAENFSREKKVEHHVDVYNRVLSNSD